MLCRIAQLVSIKKFKTGSDTSYRSRQTGLEFLMDNASSPFSRELFLLLLNGVDSVSESLERFVTLSCMYKSLAFSDLSI